jgi:hypothetical protein
MANEITTDLAVTLSCVLVECGDNVSEAARIMGLSRNSIYKIKNSEIFKRVHEETKGNIGLTNAYGSSSTEPRLLKGAMMNISLANIADYVDENGKFKGFKDLSRMDMARIKKFENKPTKFGDHVKIELYDKVDALKTLAAQHGLFDKIKIDMSLLDMVDVEDIEMLSTKYGWGEK